MRDYKKTLGLTLMKKHRLDRGGEVSLHEETCRWGSGQWWTGLEIHYVVTLGDEEVFDSPNPEYARAAFVGAYRVAFIAANLVRSATLRADAGLEGIENGAETRQP